ncbi:hypothetical protein BLNAU_17654 [Blattamonas nauphoetae]|uniref:Cyclin N-terminal domain-containing protein n=1 Tax=Blattamonas nauphoetae TaxID=2049346 RepID=A0ABQ9X6K0_9EUKA|nr:hypothetical protein BLNAU_17654 [Blattamonas nauphoetae]
MCAIIIPHKNSNVITPSNCLPENPSQAAGSNKDESFVVRHYKSEQLHPRVQENGADLQFCDGFVKAVCGMIRDHASRSTTDVDNTHVRGTSCPACDKLSKHRFSQGVEAQPVPSYEELLNVISNMMRVFQVLFRIRETELIQGYLLMKHLLDAHWNCPGFDVLRNNLHATMLTCIVIAHKINADQPFKQSIWANSFGMPLYILNMFERAVINILDWKLRVPATEYATIRSHIIRLHSSI